MKKEDLRETKIYLSNVEDRVKFQEEPKEVCEFNPFDRVLVRDSSNTRWKPRLFAWHSVEYNGDYPFETTAGGSYRYCIPYDEDLANTTKNI